MCVLMITKRLAGRSLLLCLQGIASRMFKTRTLASKLLSIKTSQLERSRKQETATAHVNRGECKHLKKLN